MPTILLLSTYPKELKAKSQRYIFTTLFGIIRISQNVEVTQMSINS